MAWEHLMAEELKKRDNKQSTVWFTGDVISPVMNIDPETEEATYDGEIVISCSGGEIMLHKDRLSQLASDDRFHAGQRVAMLGDLFGGGPGSQRILILGVVTDAV